MALPGVDQRAAAARQLFEKSGGIGPGAEIAKSVLQQTQVLQTQPNSPAAKAIEQVIVQQTAKVYAEAATMGNQQSTLTYQNLLQEQANYLAGKGVSTPEIQNIITNGVNTGIESGQSAIAGTQPSGFGTAVNVALGIGTALVTSGMGLQEQIVFNASAALIQGAKPEDVVRIVVATVAADQVPKVLGDINKTIVNAAPEIIQNTTKSLLVNAERQAVSAAATKQDVGRAALAGAVGGTVAQEVLYATDSKAIARASAEYAQYKAAGYSDEQALTKALSGFVTQQDKDAAAAKVKQQTSGLSEEQFTAAQTYGQSAEFPTAQPGQFTGTEAGGKSLAPQYSDTTATPTISTPSGFQGRTTKDVGGQLRPVTVTAQESLPGGTTTGTAGQDLSLLSADAAPAEKTPEQLRQDMILTSLINKNVSSPLYSNKTAQKTGGPGTAALAQALRVGDVGAPIFGRDEEGRRAGWNLQSLRYMGDVGAEK